MFDAGRHVVLILTTRKLGNLSSTILCPSGAFLALQFSWRMIFFFFFFYMPFMHLRVMALDPLTAAAIHASGFSSKLLILFLHNPPQTSYPCCLCFFFYHVLLLSAILENTWMQQSLVVSFCGLSF